MEEKGLGLAVDEPAVEKVIAKEDISLVDSAIFFDVEEAKKRAELAKKKIIESQMLPIYAKLNESINHGDNEVTLSLNNNQRQFLINKGFKVSVYSGTNYTIKWIYK